jgi:hypothetical protein
MFIETTFMRYGLASGGVIGIALKPETLKVWALSRHTCSRLEADMDELIENSTESEYSKHKEEGKTRIANNQCLQGTLCRSIESGYTSSEPMNIVTGQHGIEKDNVQNAVLIGM